MIFNFPRTRFVNTNGICAQAFHMASEVDEVSAAMLQPDIDHLAEEVMDSLHSCETALRILHEKHGIDINALRNRVEMKNKDRGYYTWEGMPGWTEQK